MTIVRWSPLVELDSMERRMRRLLEERGLAPALVPAADVYETDGEFVLELELPGYEAKDLEIEVFDHTLSVKGERSETTEDEEKAYRLRERLERVFERRFELPVDADSEHLKAKFGNGVLEVHAPKVPAAKPRKVAIGKA